VHTGLIRRDSSFVNLEEALFEYNKDVDDQKDGSQAEGLVEYESRGFQPQPPNSNLHHVNYLPNPPLPHCHGIHIVRGSSSSFTPVSRLICSDGRHVRHTVPLLFMSASEENYWLLGTGVND